MAIEMNFGWLNDYTGSKFAPITLANLVLMDTSNGSTETLFSYITSENKSLKDKNNQQDENISKNKERLDRLLNNNLPEGTNPMAVRMAGKLVEPSGIGNDGALMNSSYAIGINRGSNILPVYFKYGVPTPCDISEIQKKTVNYLKYENNQVSLTEYTYEGGHSNDYDNALNVDILGYARYAGEAENAIVAKSAEVARYTEQAIKLTKDIGLNEKNGDVIGTIGTTNPSNNTTLKLKNVLDKELFIGQAYLKENHMSLNEGEVMIPSFKVDAKGRIIAASADKYEIMGSLKLKTIPTKNNNLIYLIGVDSTGISKTSGLVEYYHSQGSDISKSIYIDASTSEPVLMGAAWNDYAEYRKQKEAIEPGYCVKSNDDGRVEKTTERLSICDGIVSDTFGFSIGKHADYETPLAVSGRVLAYCEGDAHDYHAGDVVCASENGKICIMTREEIKEYPDRIVGTVSEIPDYDMWNNNKVNGRIWIKVK